MDRGLQSTAIQRGGSFGGLRVRLLRSNQQATGNRQQAKMAGLLHLAFAHRYLAVTFCLLIFACCLLPASLGQQSAADSWPQFRGNHALTGVSPSTPPATLKLL